MGVFLLIIGYILYAIGITAIDYKICEFLDIIWAFWIQVWGMGCYLIGLLFIKDN